MNGERGLEEVRRWFDTARDALLRFCDDRRLLENGSGPAFLVIGLLPGEEVGLITLSTEGFSNLGEELIDLILANAREQVLYPSGTLLAETIRVEEARA